MKKGTRIAILDAFWQYVKENKLQDIENKEIINCDEKLKNVIKKICRLSKSKSLPLQLSTIGSVSS